MIASAIATSHNDWGKEGGQDKKILAETWTDGKSKAIGERLNTFNMCCAKMLARVEKRKCRK